MRLYHGTKKEFTGFDARMQQSGYFPGFYTTSNADIAREFFAKADGVVLVFEAVDLCAYDYHKDLKEEARTSGKVNQYSVTFGSGSGEVEYLRACGYDCLRRGSEYIIFDPEKSLQLIGVQQ